MTSVTASKGFDMFGFGEKDDSAYRELTGEELQIKSGGSYAGQFIIGTAKNTFMDGLKGTLIGAAALGATFLVAGILLSGAAAGLPLLAVGAFIGAGVGGIAGSAFGWLTGGAREVAGEKHERDEIRNQVDQAIMIAQDRGRMEALEAQVGNLAPPPPVYGQGPVNNGYGRY